MNYRGYEINQDNTGFAPKKLQFYYTEEDEEEIIGYAESVDECKKEIDELIKQIEMEEIIDKLKSVKLCLMAHPDNEEHSEFADRISDLEEIINELSNEIS